MHNSSSSKPKIKAVQDSYGKEQCASNEKPPHSLRKASEDMGEPCNEASKT